MAKKIIGLITAWSAEDFIEPAIKQAVKYCDEVLINISAHTSSMLRFEDKTSRIANDLVHKALRDDNIATISMIGTGLVSHSVRKAAILNGMLDHAKYYDVGNWILILDVDEFYTKESWEIMRKTINEKENEEINQILVKERYFYINMQHYLLGEHNRLFKITDANMDLNSNCRFFPTQNWFNPNKHLGTLYFPPMFHYGMLTNPWAKFAFWKSEYQEKTQDNKTLWLDKIYRNYDLENGDFWAEENKKLFGIKSPWFSDSFKSNDEGTLFEYTGKHPDVIEESGLTEITDFRGKYGFLPNSN